MCNWDDNWVPSRPSGTTVEVHTQTAVRDASTVAAAFSSLLAPASPASVAAPRQVAVDEQAAPTPRPDLPDIWELVMQDMHARAEAGFHRYGSRLRPFNSRVPLVDAYQEALDLAVYLRQKIWEDEHESR
jgi:hypothetical protein